MKKNAILLGAMMVSSFAFAQIGINTSKPTATLDVTAKNATGTTANVDGLLVPRVDRQRAQSMTTADIPNSTLIFVNSIATGDQSGNATNIDETGYYFFDGASTNKWVKLKTPAAAPTASVNIYNANGTVNSNRTVAQEDKTLAFTSTATTGTSHFSVDGSTLSVDAVNNRVGIGTTAPKHRVDLGPDFGANSTDVAGKKLAVYGNTSGDDFYGLGISAGLLQFHAASAAADAPGMVLTNKGNVGIGTSTPQKKLHVNGALQLTSELNVGGDAATAGSAGTAGQVLKSNGPGAAPTWQNLAGVPTSTGTVIVVGGQFLVAQEMTIQMSADFSAAASPFGTTIPNVIGNLTSEIIDNENQYTGTATSNSFRVSADGVYQLTMNTQISTVKDSFPVIGIWDDTAGHWVARVNDQFASAQSTIVGQAPLQTYTLITSIPMVASDTYSFRASNTSDYTIKQLSSGSTGSGPVTQVTLKRLK